MQVGTAPYMGKRLPIIVDEKQWRQFRLVSKREFRVKPKLGNDLNRFNKYYNNFLENQLSALIKKYMKQYLNKKIRYEILYTDGSKKKQKLSAKEYAALFDIDTIKFKIGAYSKEWGINQIDSKKKEFILHFNLDLIKFDRGEKIAYVVAHEVAHIFERGHDRAFNKVLEQLYRGRRSSERFWDKEFAKNI